MFPDDFTDDDRIDNDPRCRHAFDTAWEELRAGAISGNPFNFLQLATVNETRRPEVRTIVLKHADRDKATLTFVTDFRLPKMDDLDHNHHVALVGYDPANRVQIRLTGMASTVGDYDRLASLWSRLSEKTRSFLRRTDRAGHPAAPRWKRSFGRPARQHVCLRTFLPHARRYLHP